MTTPPNKFRGLLGLTRLFLTRKEAVSILLPVKTGSALDTFQMDKVNRSSVSNLGVVIK